MYVYSTVHGLSYVLGLVSRDVGAYFIGAMIVWSYHSSTIPAEDKWRSIGLSAVLVAILNSAVMLLSDGDRIDHAIAQMITHGNALTAHSAIVASIAVVPATMAVLGCVCVDLKR